MSLESSKSFGGRADFGPDDHLTDVHLAHVLGMNPGTLRNLRSQGGGPVFTELAPEEFEQLWEKGKDKPFWFVS